MKAKLVDTKFTLDVLRLPNFAVETTANRYTKGVASESLTLPGRVSAGGETMEIVWDGLRSYPNC